MPRAHGRRQSKVRNLSSRPVARRTLQHAEKSHQVGALSRAQAKRTDGRIEVGVAAGTTIVELDNGFERGEASVVHVGSSEADITEAGGLEAAAVFRRSRDLEAAAIASPANTGVVKILVSKKRARVAAAAPGLPGE